MEGNVSLIWGVIALPFLGFLIQAIFGGRAVRSMGIAKGRKLMGTLAVLPIAIAFVLGCIVTMAVANAPENARAASLTAFDWIKTVSIWIPFEVRVDPLSMTMVLVITGIGSLIHLYATGYMSEEREYTRFFTYLNLFIFFMLILVLGGNLALLFIGWEGVGLCSYLLIGFWYKDLANSRAANKAFIVNRIGDWGLTLGLFLIVGMLATAGMPAQEGGTKLLSYDYILSSTALDVFKMNPTLTTVAALLLFVGAMGKSAQFPLYVWLPDAMAGPTPVSALIHAATMVTSGIVLLNRMAPVFALSPLAGAIIAIIGAVTALFAALIAFGQTDIKKVLAYSTVSQLGYMFIACGVGAYWVGMFHVITHAFFKALLFLGSGAVIHAMAHEQDMRKYGNLKKWIPITTLTMVIGWLAISGFPLLAGFWSKEAILGNALGNTFAVVEGVNIGQMAGYVAIAVAVLTAAYMTRMTLLTFYGRDERWRLATAGHGHDAHHAHDTHHDHDAGSHEGHSHGPDEHGFFFSDDEMSALHAGDDHEHHAHLDENYNPHEVPVSMWVPLAVLAVLSVGGGFLLHNNHLLQHWLYPQGISTLTPELVPGHPEHGFFHSMLGPMPMLMAVSIGAAVLGMLYGFAVYAKGLPAKEGEDESKWSKFRLWAGNQFGFDNAVVSAASDGGGFIASGFFHKFVDNKIIDGLVNGAGTVARTAGGLLKYVQTGYVRSYALMMLLGVITLVGSIAAFLLKGGLR